MNLKTKLIIICVSLSLVACGALGGKKGSSGESSFDKLSGLSADLQAQLDKTMAPITETDAVIQRLTDLPKTLNLSPDDYKDFVIYAIRGEIRAPEGASEDVKKQLTAFGKDLKTYKVKLFATPDEALELTKSIGGALLSVPTLVGKIEAEAQVTKANPLASKKEKAQADKRSKEAKTLGDQTTSKVQEIQKEAQSLPGKAKDAIAKFTGALKSVGIDNLDSLKDVGSDTAKDAKKAANQTVNTAKDAAKDSVDAAKSTVE